MPGFYTKADYENSIIELFQNMGYHYVYGPDVDRDFSSPLYEVELDAALHCLNPTMPEDAIADALFKLKNFENAESLWITFSRPLCFSVNFGQIITICVVKMRLMQKDSDSTLRYLTISAEKART